MSDRTKIRQVAEAARAAEAVTNEEHAKAVYTALAECFEHFAEGSREEDTQPGTEAPAADASSSS
jgi:hypothetical protein